MPGWPAAMKSWGYHGDDGGIFINSGFPTLEYETYSAGDTIGCGVDNQKRLFLTKNGQMLGEKSGPTLLKGADTVYGHLGKPTENVSGQLFAVVGFRCGGTIKANFGPEFMYHLESYGDSGV